MEKEKAMLTQLSPHQLLSAGKQNLASPAIYPNVWPTGFTAANPFPTQDDLKTYQRIAE